MYKRPAAWYLLGLISLLSGGCVADSMALRLHQTQHRFSVNDVQLGSSQTSVLSFAKTQFNVDPECIEKKVGNKNNKRAYLEQTCIYSNLKNIYLSDQEVSKIVYFFVGAYLQQVDIELVAKNANSLKEMANSLSESLMLQDESNGSLHKWVGATDAALLIQQGNIKLRILPSKMLPENSKGLTILPRS